MHEIQIHVVQTQSLQTFVESLFYSAMIRAPQLGGHEEVLALDLARGQSCLDAIADFLLVSVARGAVDVTVSHGDGVADGVLDLSGFGLPGSWNSCQRDSISEKGFRLRWRLRDRTESQSGNLRSRVELESCVGNTHDGRMIVG